MLLKMVFKKLVLKDGVEKKYNQVLQGKPGIRKIEVDAKNKYTRQDDVIPGVKGKTVLLSINKRIQNIISNHIGNYNGAVLISLIETPLIKILGSIVGIDIINACSYRIHK